MTKIGERGNKKRVILKDEDIINDKLIRTNNTSAETDTSRHFVFVSGINSVILLKKIVHVIQLLC